MFSPTLAFIAALHVSAAASGTAPPGIQAVPTRVRPVIDGRLDDAVWSLAPVLDGFVQLQPEEGRAASERTEVRILYDEHAIYVAFRCWDSKASLIHPRLGRRDNAPESDWVAVTLDPFHDRRSAYWFSVNSASVQTDGILTEGAPDNYNWDGLWNARTSVDAEGWSAELEIPFVTLRFPRGGVQTWGFHITRYISRMHETDAWNFIRITDATQIGQYEELRGIEGARPGLSLQVIPYLSSTVQASLAEANLAPREDHSWQVGLDAKYALTGTLTLDATLNPDFAQVEVDPQVVNLSPFEVFFPEKRPFFLEGLDIFQSVGQLIFTRRIGASPPAPEPQHGGDIVELDSTARIVGALKMTGNLRPGTAVGLLAGYVDQTMATERVGPGALSPTYRLEATPGAFFSAARVRQVLFEKSTLGVTETSVLRGGAGWFDAHMLDAEFELRGRSDYALSATFGRTFTMACDPAYSPSFRGKGTCDPYEANVTAGKLGGEVQAFGVFDYNGAEYDINDLGIQAKKIGNQSVGQSVNLGYVRNRGWGPFKQGSVRAFWVTLWDPNAVGPGVGAPLIEHRIGALGELRLQNNWTLAWNFQHAFPFADDVETRQNPLVHLYRRRGAENNSITLSTNPARPLALSANAHMNYDYRTESWIYDLSTDATVLAGGRLQLGAHAGWTQWLGRPRWVDTGAMSGLPLFGTLDLDQLEMTVRGTFAFSRDLTLQLFSQLLRSAQHYTHLAELTDSRTFLPCDPAPAMSCADAGPASAYDHDLTSLIVNAVARWQFGPGSTVYLVYTHNHQVAGDRGRLDFSNALSTLGASAADNVLAFKLSYLWAL